MSSDTYYYRIGAELQLAQNPTLQNVARQFGYGSDSGIDLPAEISGTVPDAALKKRLAERDPPVISPDEGRGYFVGDNVLFAIGQGLLSATPLQLTNAYATFANGGNRMRPMVALGIVKPGTPDLAAGDGGQVNPFRFDWIEKFKPEVKAQVAINPDWWSTMNRGFSGVVSSGRPFGTAFRTFEGYPYRAMPISGKTGTAQDAAQEGNKDDSLFAAYGPNHSTGHGAVGGRRGRRGRWLRCVGGGPHRQVHVHAALADPSRMAPLNQSEPARQDGHDPDARRRRCRTPAAWPSTTPGRRAGLMAILARRRHRPSRCPARTRRVRPPPRLEHPAHRRRACAPSASSPSTRPPDRPGA